MKKTLLGSTAVLAVMVLAACGFMRERQIRGAWETDATPKRTLVLHEEHTYGQRLSGQTLGFLSHLRLGINLERIKDIDLRTINELFLLTQPAHLQRLHGKKLDSDARRQARADYIRSRLNGN